VSLTRTRSWDQAPVWSLPFAFFRGCGEVVHFWAGAVGKESILRMDGGDGVVLKSVMVDFEIIELEWI
jgi:hypothetical protein